MDRLPPSIRVVADPTDGATDAQRGRISAGSPGSDGEWDERSGGFPGVRSAPGHGAQDAGLFGATRLPAKGPAAPAQTRALHRRHRPHPGRGSQGSQKAAPHRQAHLREAQGRVRLRRSVHHHQGLRPGASPADQGDVRPVVPSAGAQPVRLRRGPGGHRRRGAEGPLLRPRPATQRTAAL